jgi:RecA-family ATPase
MRENIEAALSRISPASLDYEEWLAIGQAIHSELPNDFDLWDNWSKQDSRYNGREMKTKWRSFSHGAVTIATLYHFAKWTPPREQVDRANAPLGWEEYIYCAPRTDAVDFAPIAHGKEALVMFLKALYKPDDIISVCGVYLQETDNGKPRNAPKSYVYQKQSHLIRELTAETEYNDEVVIKSAFSFSYDHLGVWNRINPMKMGGRKDDEVTSYRYTLVEADEGSLEEQYARIIQLRLPVAAIIHSGGKSIHAIVKIHAANEPEYIERVQTLHRYLMQNGMKFDKACKNPSRTSRLPGVMRHGQEQALLALDKGYNTWDEFIRGIQNEQQAYLTPRKITFNDSELPPLKTWLIEKVLRKGHICSISGPSKAGKTIGLIQLAHALANGGKWMGFQTHKCKVLYLDFEVDESSLQHRFTGIGKAMGYDQNSYSFDNFSFISLRGRMCQAETLFNDLANKFAANTETAHDVIIIDPVYKIMEGDENDNREVSNFFKSLEKLAIGMGATLIFSHHHSKGTQLAKKSMDRGSGAGAFARAPDAILDLVEIPLDDAKKKISVHDAFLKAKYAGIIPPIASSLNPAKLIREGGVGQWLSPHEAWQAQQFVTEESGNGITLWQLEGTLREARAFHKHIAFCYPLHIEIPEDEKLTAEAKAGAAGVKRKDNSFEMEEIKTAIMGLEAAGETIIPISKVMEQSYGASKKSVLQYAKENKLKVEAGKIHLLQVSLGDEEGWGEVDNE